jgi:hypothetical protein
MVTRAAPRKAPRWRLGSGDFREAGQSRLGRVGQTGRLFVSLIAITFIAPRRSRPGGGPARRVICGYVDGQAHDPVKRAPALVASGCAITGARNLLARRNVSLGKRLIAASSPKRTAVKKMSAAR